MIVAPSSRDGSSTSPTTPSPSWRHSGAARSTSGSLGSRLLTRRALRALAARHGVRPRRRLGQHFLADPNLARAIVREAGVRPGDRVVEVGAGLGSLTVALAEAGASVLAIEVDRALLPALREVTSGLDVRVEWADATKAGWFTLLGSESWRMVSNLPYNVAVPVVVDLLEQAPSVDPMLVMVQREVGERLAARAGEDAYGAVSLRVAFRASSAVARRVSPTVFWPEPKVDSVLVRLQRHPPPVAASEEAIFRLVDEGFRQRRKTMTNALVRLGVGREAAAAAIERAGLDPRVRAEELSLQDFSRLAEAL